MPRVTKSTPAKEVSTSSSIISDNIQLSGVAVPAPVKTPRAKKAAKEVAPVVDIVSVASTTTPLTTELVEENIVLEQVALDADPTLIVQSLEFFGKLQQLGVLISSIKTEYRSLEKKWTRDLKAAQKKGGKSKRKQGVAGAQTRAPSGFVKPTRISDELAIFLGKETGTEMARTSVTRDINAYIRSNSLQDVDNGRKIIPDSKLATLLKLTKEDELTYFNLQKYMSPHFHKNVKVDATVAQVQVEVV